jgi:hypothetical protein
MEIQLKKSGHRMIIRTLILMAFIAYMAMPAEAMDDEGNTNNPTVIITDYKITPSVLLPGDKGTITIILKNTAQSASLKENSGVALDGVFTMTKSTDINVYIERVKMEGNGITVLTKAFDRLGSLGPGQSVPVTFVIQAPENNGIFFPEAWINVKDGRSTRYPVTVNVNTDISTQKKPALSVTQSLPDRIASGDDCIAGITITNTGLTRASDITVLVNSTIKSLVLTSPGRYYVEHLNPGEMKNLTLRFATDKNTPLGIDPVTLSVTYHNPDGSSEWQTETIGIPIKGKANIAVKSFLTDPAVPAPGSAFTLITRVENTGTDQATSVKVTLDSPLSGTKTAFIGSIDKNSDGPALFSLHAAGDGIFPANLTIWFSDDFGHHTISEQATITTGPSSAMLPVAGVILVAVLIAGGAYWHFRVRSGKRNGK